MFIRALTYLLRNIFLWELIRQSLALRKIEKDFIPFIGTQVLFYGFYVPHQLEISWLWILHLNAAEISIGFSLRPRVIDIAWAIENLFKGGGGQNQLLWYSIYGVISYSGFYSIGGVVEPR